MRRRQLKTGSSADRKTIADYEGRRDAASVSRYARGECVAVWDTVGSYENRLAPLARYFTLAVLLASLAITWRSGFTAVGVDGAPASFCPEHWTIAKGQKPKGHVEQTWFTGAHCNVGGESRFFASSTRMDDRARPGAHWSGVQCRGHKVRHQGPVPSDGAVVDSTEGWPSIYLLPHYPHLSLPIAIHHGYLFNSEDPAAEHINERVHWSVIAKRQDRATPRSRNR